MRNLTRMEMEREERVRKTWQEHKDVIRQNVLEIVPEIRNNPFVRIPLSCSMASLPFWSHCKVKLSEFSDCSILMCIRCGAVFLNCGGYGVSQIKFYGYGNPNKKQLTWSER